MDKSDRKLSVLQAIIQNYLETAEPVGSRTISKLLPIGVSAATIRNEMADLEEMGLIEQPYTSAGRIPSAKGYRLYVDELMQQDNVSDEQWSLVRRILNEKSNQLDSLLCEIGDLLASVTQYTTIVTTPHLTKACLKRLQLIPMDEKNVVMVAITDGNHVSNHIIPYVGGYTDEDLVNVTKLLNEKLCGLSISDITLPLLEKIKRMANVDQGVMESFMDALHDTLKNVDDVGIHTAGASNMLNFPEFSDVGRAKDFIEFLQKKDEVKKLVKPDIDYEHIDPEDSQVRIAIGKENHHELLDDCSVITATYHYHNMELGSISVVGPMRMDYQKVVGALNHLTNEFPQLFDAQNKEENEEK